MVLSVAQFYQERFYSDTLAILSNWKDVLLRFEYLLLYKKWIPSFTFFCIVQVAYWYVFTRNSMVCFQDSSVSSP